jgi:transposase
MRVLQAPINKTDRNDARGMAQMLQAELYRLVHVKDAAQSETANAVDPSQATAVQATAVNNDLRRILRNFGLEVGLVGTVSSRRASRSSRTCPI